MQMRYRASRYLSAMQMRYRASRYLSAVDAGMRDIRAQAGRRPLAQMESWWSQTGSNRRPPACKAGALPTELWPRLDLHGSRPCGHLPGSDLVKDPATCEHWWAWKDLNFRPHAYQARALTN